MKESGRVCMACGMKCVSLSDCFDGIDLRLERKAAEPPIPDRRERFAGSRFDK